MQNINSRCSPFFAINVTKFSVLHSLLCYGFFIAILYLLKKKSINVNSTVCEMTEDFYFSVELQNEDKLLIMYNKTSKQLYSMKVLQKNRQVIYNLFDAYEIAKALKECNSDTLCHGIVKNRIKCN